MQAVQNAAASVVVRQRKRNHIVPPFRELHWLPVHDRILHQMLSITCRSIHENPPLCLPELIPRYTPSCSLRSSSESLLNVPGPKDHKTKRKTSEPFQCSLRSCVKVEVAVLGSPCLTACGRKATLNLNSEPPEVCERRVCGRPGLPVPNSPYGLCGRKETLKQRTFRYNRPFPVECPA